MQSAAASANVRCGPRAVGNITSKPLSCGQPDAEQQRPRNSIRRKQQRASNWKGTCRFVNMATHCCSERIRTASPSRFPSSHALRITMNRRPLLSVWLPLSVLLSIVAASPGWCADATAVPPRWDLEQLGKAPQEFPAPEVTAPEVQSLFYEGLAYQGKPTRVFAYYAARRGQRREKSARDGPDPRRRRNRLRRLGPPVDQPRLCGHLHGPLRLRAGAQRGPKARLEAPRSRRPAGLGRLRPDRRAPGDQWTYHAVADVMLAHSLLRGRPEVDASGSA